MSRKPLIYVMISFFVSGILVLHTGIPVVYGKPFRLNKIPQEGLAFGCKICHVNPRGGHKLNPFGKDYGKIAVKANETYTKELGEMDSDGDGFSNDTEFKSNTHPGDPDSTPQTE